MRFKIFLEDLNPDVISRIKWTLRYELSDEFADEIDEAAACGIGIDTIGDEIIDDYLNRHNCGFEVEL